MEKLEKIKNYYLTVLEKSDNVEEAMELMKKFKDYLLLTKNIDSSELKYVEQLESSIPIYFELSEKIGKIDLFDYPIENNSLKSRDNHKPKVKKKTYEDRHYNDYGKVLNNKSSNYYSSSCGSSSYSTSSSCGSSSSSSSCGGSYSTSSSCGGGTSYRSGC